MCGIAGEVGRIGQLVRADMPSFNRIKHMIGSLTHRGPDEQRFWTNTTPNTEFSDSDVFLGMCRLAIIDREHGQQPFGEKCKVFFNGEIYNHKSIRDDLCMDNICSATNCDSEVLADLYERVGDRFTKNLDGMFAIAIWDKEQEVLKLYRDRIGKKPLYYFFDEANAVFLFASEIKAILTHPAYEKQINLAGIWQYISMQYIPEPETAFKDIRCVPPGSMIEYDPKVNTLRTEQYWEFPDSNVIFDGSETENVRNIVRSAVHKRLESEVPLGVYLSGGIDSAIITALAAEKIKDLHTFTMGFLEDQYDERGGAQLIADRYKTNHHVAVVESVDMVSMAKDIVEQYDQPFGDCSAIPTMLLARLSKPYITVALNGDGGDEAFGGYPRYWMSNLSDYWKFMCVWPPDKRADIWPGYDAEVIWPQNYINSHIRPNDNRTGLMFADMVTYLPNDIIVKMERATMAASIEARCPFLDPKVLRFGLSLPIKEQIKAQEGKLILKRAFADYLPQQTLRAEKRGFAVPMNEWLRSPEGILLLSQTILKRKAFQELPGFNNNVLNQIAIAHYNREVNIGHALWVMIMLEMWLERHFR
jgi:asparagine synthase (glutamine-hydrolysing)